MQARAEQKGRATRSPIFIHLDGAESLDAEGKPRRRILPSGFGPKAKRVEAVSVWWTPRGLRGWWLLERVKVKERIEDQGDVDERREHRIELFEA